MVCTFLIVAVQYCGFEVAVWTAGLGACIGFAAAPEGICVGLGLW
jgi:hypothetical protein